MASSINKGGEALLHAVMATAGVSRSRMAIEMVKAFVESHHRKEKVANMVRQLSPFTSGDMTRVEFVRAFAEQLGGEYIGRTIVSERRWRGATLHRQLWGSHGVPEACASPPSLPPSLCHLRSCWGRSSCSLTLPSRRCKGNRGSSATASRRAGCRAR